MCEYLCVWACVCLHANVCGAGALCYGGQRRQLFTPYAMWVQDETQVLTFGLPTDHLPAPERERTCKKEKKITYTFSKHIFTEFEEY